MMPSPLQESASTSYQRQGSSFTLLNGNLVDIRNNFDRLFQSRRRHNTRPQKEIEISILDACRTPTVQHWIMVKARLGYDTFWKHMNNLTSLGMMDTLDDGNRRLYVINGKGLTQLQKLVDEGI
jgi:predicted transcriptional regulator